MSKPYRLGAHAAIFDQEDNILLTQHQTYNNNEWNFPGGGREKGEDAIQNALREIKEELNLDPQDLQVLGVSAHPNVYNFPQSMVDEGRPIAQKYQGQHKDHVLLRFVGDKSSIQLDPREVRQAKWVPIKDLSTHLIFPNQFQSAQLVIEEYLQLKPNLKRI